MQPGHTATRVLMYSHDTFGLGHLTRTVRIADALRKRDPRVSILILTGSPVAPYVVLPPGADFVKLPSVVKAGQEKYRSRDLAVSFSQIRRLRAELIRGTVEAFRPHVFLVDNVPLGMKREVLPSLEHLRSSPSRGKTVLILRDVLDDPKVIRETWDRDGVGGALAHLYDRVFIMGDEDVYPAAELYGLPATKTSYVGYAAPGPRLPFDQRSDRGRQRTVLMTVGGGGDGGDFLIRALNGLASTGAPSMAATRLDVVTGPLMDPGLRTRISGIAPRANAEVYEFVPDLPRRIHEADLVVAMAGYNTCCEILSSARRALVVPRTKPRIEQWLRAQAFEKRAICSTLDLDEEDGSVIADAIHRAVESGPLVERGRLPRLDGLEEVARRIHEVLDSPTRRTVQVGAAARRSLPQDIVGDPPAHCRSVPGAIWGRSWFWPGRVVPVGAPRISARGAAL